MHLENEASPTRAGGNITLPRAHVMAVIVCWLFVVFDGYDLIVYGNVISSLQGEWGISASTAGTLGSLAFVGMMIGAVLAGGALLTLLLDPPVAAVYLIFVLAGVGTHGTQALIIAAVASYYPDHLRGTALGWALGVGRIGAVAAPQIGGWLLAAGLGAHSNFVLFGVSALVSSLLLTVIWKKFPARHESLRPVPTH